MKAETSFAGSTKSFVTAAHIALWLAVICILTLCVLHILSPEFDPSWRMVSEYALGHYSWVLSLMFICWALSSWFLAYSIWPQIKTRGGKIGLIFLILAGVGEAMASVFDVTHSLHSVSAMIGVPSLPIAAMLISISLSRTQEWSAEKKTLLWTSNMTWVSLILMAATFAILIVSFAQSGAVMNTEITAVKTLPPGVIALVGWANRLLIVVYCIWVMTLARKAIRLQRG